MLEQAKENLRSRFTAFGIVERFDESLAMLKGALDLSSVVYVQRRVTSRPRGADVPDDAAKAVKALRKL